MKDKVYIGFVAETEMNGCTIIPEYFFETRVFSTLEKARRSLNDWIYDVLIEDEELEEVPGVNKEETLIVRNTKTSWGEDWIIPCYRCWIEEKGVE